MPEASACNTSNIYVANNPGSYTKVYGPDGNNGDNTLNKTYSYTDVERGGTVYFKFKIAISPGCGSYYEVMFKTKWKPPGWTVRILDNTTGIGKNIGDNIDGIAMGSLDTPKDGFSGTISYECDVIVTAAKDAPLGKNSYNYVDIEVYSEDRACNDEDHIFIKLPFQVVEAHDPPVVTLISPKPDTVVDRWLPIEWTATDKETPDSELKIDILFKKTTANTWTTALRGLPNSGSCTWNCSRIDDGEYLLKVKAFDKGVPQKAGQKDVPIMINNPNAPDVIITSPDPTQSEVFQIEMPIRWTATDEEEEDDSVLSISIYYTVEGTIEWFLISENEPNDGEYLWNITDIPDRPDYRIKVIARDSMNMEGECITLYKHQINNLDGPVVEMVYPTGGQTFSGKLVIYWQAKDSDGDTLTIDIEWSDDAGMTWDMLAEGLSNDGSCSYAVDTLSLDDGDQYMIKVTASDGELFGYKCCSKPFEIFNNDVPKLEILTPSPTDDLKDDVLITWEASDGEGEDAPNELISDVYYKVGAGTYNVLLTGQENEGQFLWETRSNPEDFIDGVYGIKVVITDTNGAVVEKEIEGMTLFNPDKPRLTVETPIEGETIKGSYPIRISCQDPDLCDEGEEMISIYYSNDQGATWHTIVENMGNDPDRFLVTKSWDTDAVDDGLYQIKVIASDGELTSEVIVRNVTVFNYFNYQPEIEILEPIVFESTLSGNHTLKWTAQDQNEEDVLLISIGWSRDYATYEIFAEDIENSGEYIWDTTTLDDGQYTLKFIVKDGNGLEAYEISTKLFIKNNEDEDPDPEPINNRDDVEGRGSGTSLGLIIGIAMAIVLLLGILGGLIFLYTRSRSTDSVDPLKQPLPSSTSQGAVGLGPGVQTGALPQQNNKRLPPPPGQGLPPAQF
ncbi:MAG: hypothetical protein ACMUHB_06665 [Thermoplasmatota archaeon]